MQWGVNLEGPFSYSKFGVFLLVIIIIIVVIMLIKKHNKNKPQPIRVVVKVVDRNRIRMEYVAKLNNLITKVNNNSISTRKAYNELSVIIREFIYRTTRVNLLKYSLNDFRKLNNKTLLELINEYYEPEFSYEGSGDILASIEKTRKVIVEWK